MSDTLLDLVSRMFVGPLWPASILVCLMVLYTLMALIGLIDFEMDAPDLDFDPGIDLEVPADWDFWHGIGAASVRWTNFGRVPVLIWAGLFTIAYWAVSFLLWHGFDSERYSPTWLPSLLLSIRNIVIATGITKALTQPLIGYFLPGPSYDVDHLIGATCEVSTSEVTPKFGQGKFRTQAAPLLLNIRTDGPHIAKGTEVRIIAFDKEKRTYIVAPLPLEKES